MIQMMRSINLWVSAAFILGAIPALAYASESGGASSDGHGKAATPKAPTHTIHCKERSGRIAIIEDSTLKIGEICGSGEKRGKVIKIL